MVQANANEEMKWKEEVFPSTHDERLRMQAQQFEKAGRCATCDGNTLPF